MRNQKKKCSFENVFNSILPILGELLSEDVIGGELDGFLWRDQREVDCCSWGESTSRPMTTTSSSFQLGSQAEAVD